MMRAPGEKSEMAELLEMVQNDGDSSHPASPRAIQSALAITKPEKVAKSVNSWSRRVGLVAVWFPLRFFVVDLNPKASHASSQDTKRFKV